MARSAECAPSEALISIDPRVVDLWLAAMQLPTSLRSVTLVDRTSPPPRRDTYETHTVPTLIACLRGVVRVECVGRNLDLNAGEAALIAPGAWHRHAALKAGSACLGQGFMLGRSDMELSVPGKAWWLAIPEQPSRDLLTQACSNDARSRVVLVREALGGLRDGSARPVRPMPTAVQRMWLYLRRERLSPITAADVLRASGLGATRAHLLFRAYFDETPHRLLTRHRLEFACHLLVAGESPGVVAGRCGFRSRRQFTAAFNSAFGAGPREWVKNSHAHG
jgi:AraC-like DNA-binding protein